MLPYSRRWEDEFDMSSISGDIVHFEYLKPAFSEMIEEDESPA